MSPGFCGGVGHHRSPRLAFSATMAVEVGRATPSGVVVNCTSGAGFVAGRAGRRVRPVPGLRSLPPAAGWGPEEAASAMPKAAAAVAAPPTAVQPRNRRRSIRAIGFRRPMPLPPGRREAGRVGSSCRPGSTVRTPGRAPSPMLRAGAARRANDHQVRLVIARHAPVRASRGRRWRPGRATLTLGPTGWPAPAPRSGRHGRAHRTKVGTPCSSESSPRSDRG